jgi:hypothetical protein
MLTVSEVARDIEGRTGQAVSPQDVSNLIYRRVLDHRRCPMVGRVRAIPPDYVPQIEQVLHQRGILKTEAASR